MSPERRNYHSYFYIGGIMLLAASLPLSPFMVTVSQIILLVNWYFEDNIKTRIHKVWERKALFIFLMIFIVHLIWLIPTQDYAYALKDLKIKLPILILPLIFGTSRRLRENELKMILLVFIASVTVSSFFSINQLATTASISLADLRDISIFISHIRLSLFVNVSIFSLIYLLITGSFQWQRALRNTLWATLTWLIFFLFILQSITGIVIFIITGALFLFKFSHSFEQQYWYIRYPLLYGLATVTLVLSAYTLAVILSFSNQTADEDKLKETTPAGNPYVHHIWNKQMENGNYVWINISEQELRREWNRLSSIDFYGEDMQGHEVRHTLIRYLTSRGLDKDAEGIAQLSETDILNIERGMANHIYQHRKWLYPRIYQIIWEIDNYRKGGNPSGHSFAQRLEYWKTGLKIIKTNFWFGTGTGDVDISYEAQYASGETLLSPQWQLRAHNQFLTFFISFGITGFIIVIFSMMAPFFIERRQYHMLPFIFACIAMLSMLTEDTLETQAGATFFALFYALFIFSMDNNGAEYAYMPEETGKPENPDLPETLDIPENSTSSDNNDLY